MSVIASQEKLQYVPYISYIIQFSRNKINALVDLGSEIHVLNSALAWSLNIIPRIANIGAQKIDGSSFRTYKMVYISFSLQDGCKTVRFFKKFFFLTDTNVKIVVRIHFLSSNNTNVKFDTERLT